MPVIFQPTLLTYPSLTVASMPLLVLIDPLVILVPRRSVDPLAIHYLMLRVDPLVIYGRMMLIDPLARFHPWTVGHMTPVDGFGRSVRSCRGMHR